MLKIENIENELLFCLHPACPQSHQRCFDPMQPHGHDRCERWVASLNEVTSGEQEKFSPKQIKDIEIDFEYSPISSLRALDKLRRSPWEAVVDQEERCTKL